MNEIQEQAIAGAASAEVRREPVLRFAHATGEKPLAGFTIKRGIGVGGFGEVYFAVSDAGKEVALKKIQRNLDIELRGVSHCLNLKHPNLLAVFDVRFDADDQAWVVMEFVNGDSLSDVLDRYPDGLPSAELSRWFLGTAAGVEYLHQHGIVHRDLKPGNVFSDEDFIKVGDYGLSKYISCSRRSGQTESVGTFHYMAPEIGKGNYGKEIDIYALGVILYEMLTGIAPFDGESSQEIIMKHLTANPDLTPVPEPFRPIVAKALAKDASKRYASVGDLRKDVEQALAGTELANGDAVEAGIGMSAIAKPQPADDLLFIDENTDASASPEEEIVLAETVAPEIGRSQPPQSSAAKAKSAEPLFIDDQPPAMTFGPVRQSSPGHKSAKTQPVVAGQAASAAASTNLASASTASPRGGYRLGRWWAEGSSSTLLKVLFVCGLLALVFVNSSWLLVAGVLLGSLFVAYFGMRSVLVSLHGNEASRADRRLNKLSRKQSLEASLADKSIPERSVELTGSLLSSAIVMGVLALLMLVAGGPALNNSIYVWNLGAWLAITGTLASWSILAAGKFWEGKSGGELIRRLVMLTVGLSLGGFAYGLSQILMISQELTVSVAPVSRNLAAGFTQNGIALLPAYMTFFGVLFLILRWWNQANPLRGTRMSLVTTGLAILWGWAVGELVLFPQPWGMLLAGSIALTVQLVSPWLSQAERSEIRQAYLSDHGRIGELT